MAAEDIPEAPVNRRSNDFLLGEIHAKVQDIPKIKEDIETLRVAVAELKVKSGVWGGVAGAMAFTILFAATNYRKLFDLLNK